ncbi:MAG: 3'-5' exonuclease [Planctomycetes bacterium]|nr:3'-5' exonuclease [Planctomycetota bacterium]MCB9904415.1 3'-5' exonuclease [Planctomycetota bacterium]
MDRPLVVLDTETATLQGAPHLLELGAVRVVDGEIEDSFESFVRPEVAIEEEATAIHGIAESDVRNAPTAAEVLERFNAWAGDNWFAAHSAGFDVKVLAYEHARARLEPPAGLFMDSLKLAKKHIPEAADHKLPTLCQHLELEEGPHHRALSDAVYCWKVIEECFERAGGLQDAKLATFLSGAPLTITSALPPEPRLPRRLRPLGAALAEEREVVALYGETSSPASIPLLPRFLFEHRSKGYLEALCPRSGTLRTYRLDRLHKIL